MNQKSCTFTETASYRKNRWNNSVSGLSYFWWRKSLDYSISAEPQNKQASALGTQRCITRVHIPWQRASQSSEGCWDSVLHLITWASCTASSIWARSLWPFITLNCSHRQPLCCNNPPMLGLSYSSLPQLNATLVIWALGEIWRIVLERASRLKSLGLFYIKAASVRTQQGRANAAINHPRRALGPQAFCWLHTFCFNMWPHYSISHILLHKSTPWWIRSGLHFWRTKGHQDDLVVALRLLQHAYGSGIKMLGWKWSCFNPNVLLNVWPSSNYSLKMTIWLASNEPK